jgi:hypothetical protein
VCGLCEQENKAELGGTSKTTVEENLNLQEQLERCREVIQVLRLQLEEEMIDHHVSENDFSLTENRIIFHSRLCRE